MHDDDATIFPFVVREAQRYAHLLPAGVRLAEASPQQVADAIHRGHAEEKTHPELYNEAGYRVAHLDDGDPTVEMPAVTDATVCARCGGELEPAGGGDPTVLPWIHKETGSSFAGTGSQRHEATAQYLQFDRIVFGSLEELHGLRAGLRRYLNGCPLLDDLILIISELAANAILHSASRDLYFTVRVEIGTEAVKVEVEDLGGPWLCRPVDDRPHGLDLVAFIADDWGTEVRSCDGRRIVWAQLAIPQAGPSALSHLMATWQPENNVQTIHEPTLCPTPQTLNVPRRGRSWPRPTSGGDRIA